MDRADDAPSGNDDQVAYWNGETGARWAVLQECLDAVFTPLTAALLDRAAPGPGERVLDVGCGTGATVLALAGAVGPSGHVRGVDVSQPMLAVARKRVAARGLPAVDLVLADAAVEAFAPAGVDLVLSRFGVMFFADPVAAFQNIRTGVAVGGRLAFACWQPLDANPWMAVPAAALTPLLAPAPPPDPHAPGPFAFADPGRVRAILEQAGFASVTVAPYRTGLLIGGDVATAVDLLTQVGPASRALRDAAPGARPGLVAALAAALVPYGKPEGVVLDGAIWLVSAQA